MAVLSIRRPMTYYWASAQILSDIYFNVLFINVVGVRLLLGGVGGYVP